MLISLPPILKEDAKLKANISEKVFYTFIMKRISGSGKSTSLKLNFDFEADDQI